MLKRAIIGQPAPEPRLASWVQGEATSLQQLLGQVVLIEVFQVNCPGCFVHALPAVIELHDKYAASGLQVIGLATAFEHFDINTEANLQRLLRQGELVGDPLRQLTTAGLAVDGRVDYRIDFPVALDAHEQVAADTSAAAVRQFILEQVPDFDQRTDEDRAIITRNARQYLAARTQKPLTFSDYGLQGTPASILIDRRGLLHDVAFGWTSHLDDMITRLL